MCAEERHVGTWYIGVYEPLSMPSAPSLTACSKEARVFLVITRRKSVNIHSICTPIMQKQLLTQGKQLKPRLRGPINEIQIDEGVELNQ